MLDQHVSPISVTGDETPASIALGSGAGADALMIACVVLGIVALTAVLSVFSARRRARDAARIARARTRKLGEWMRTVRMAENIADLGIWQYEPATGIQHWSRGMRAIFGIDHDDPFVAGDAETVLLANDVDLVATVMHYSDAIDPFEMRFEMTDQSGSIRTLCVQACNLPDEFGEVSRVIAVVRDVGDQVARAVSFN